MDKKYQAVLDVVKADIERVNNNLILSFDLRPKLARELEKFLYAPSKRIRSLVTILYLRASKFYLLPSHYELLASVELIHNASLIHDDIIDGSEIRRNKTTLNKKFDNHLAVISGDYLLGAALKKLVKINSMPVIDIFADTMGKMCKGEISQYFDKFKKVSLEKYIEKSSEKTASLFNAALSSSIILSGEAYNEKAEEFAINFGTAFQIRDDLLNVLKKDKTKSSTDIDEGVYNAPLILSNDITVGVEKTKDLLNNYVNCARHCMQDLGESPYKAALFELLELISDV